MPRTKFSSKEHYLNAAINNPGELAFVPVSFAAEMIGVKRSTVNDLVRTNKLVKISIQEDEQKWSGIKLQSLQNYISSLDSIEKTALLRTREILEKCAKEEEVVEYGVLLKDLGMTHINPHHRRVIGNILGEISSETWGENGFMLSALAVNKSGQFPNDGFFHLAKELEAIEDIDDEDECRDFFDQQKEAIYEYFE